MSSNLQPAVFQSAGDAQEEVVIPKGDPDVFDPKTFKTDYFLFKNSTLQVGIMPAPLPICNGYSDMRNSKNDSPPKYDGITSDL